MKYPTCTFKFPLIVTGVYFLLWSNSLVKEKTVWDISYKFFVQLAILHDSEHLKLMWVKKFFINSSITTQYQSNMRVCIQVH